MKKNLVAVVFILTVLGTAWGNVIYYGGDFDLSIPDNGKMSDAVIDIDHYYTIFDLDVRINIVHTNVFDLQIFLQGPSGERVCLNIYDFEKDFFVGQNYIDTIFDDQADIAIADGTAAFTGRFRPRDELSIFNGGDCFGVWKLEIYDTYYNDTGYLESFELMIVNPEPSSLMLLGTGALFFRRRRT